MRTFAICAGVSAAGLGLVARAALAALEHRQDGHACRGLAARPPAARRRRARAARPARDVEPLHGPVDEGARGARRPQPGAGAVAVPEGGTTAALVSPSPRRRTCARARALPGGAVAGGQPDARASALGAASSRLRALSGSASAAGSPAAEPSLPSRRRPAAAVERSLGAACPVILPPCPRVGAAWRGPPGQVRTAVRTAGADLNEDFCESESLRSRHPLCRHCRAQ